MSNARFYLLQPGTTSQLHRNLITPSERENMARRSVNKKTVRTTIAFASITIFLMVAPALASAYFGAGLYTVMSQSMKPHMSAGDAIITDVVSAHDVRVGDIVLTTNPDNMKQVAHRVVQNSTIDNIHYTITTKGDSNPQVDMPALTFHSNAPLRKVIAVVPKVGYALDLISSTITKTAGSLALIAYLIYLVRKTRRTVELNAQELNSLTSDEEINVKVQQLVQEHLTKITGASPATLPTVSRESVVTPAEVTSQLQRSKADIYL